jgi:hypothetical protein
MSVERCAEKQIHKNLTVLEAGPPQGSQTERPMLTGNRGRHRRFFLSTTFDKLGSNMVNPALGTGTLTIEE